MDSRAVNVAGDCSFDVRMVQVDDLESQPALCVGVAEKADGSGRALVFQLAHEFDDQDRALGMDTYAISTDTGATIYGGVTHYVLTDRLLSIWFSDNASTKLGIGRECQLALSVDPESLAKLRDGLRRILGNRD